jgi:ACS family tartrate transporter-like MFS transporter
MARSPGTVVDGAIVDGAIRKALWRLVPLMMLMYILSYLDRVNIGFAATSMNADLGLSATAFGIGAGLFFVGYSALEVPSNLILHRVGARVWIARIMVTWGVISACMALVQNEWSFYALRLLLGIAEAGFVPGIVFYTTLWFPKKIRGRVVALFLMSIPFAVVLGAPVSSLLIEHGDGVFGLAGWQFMFLVEGIPTVILGLFIFMLLPSSPDGVSWLSSAEKQALQTELVSENAEAQQYGHSSVRASLADWRIYVVSFFAFCANMGGYSLSFFLPLVILSFETQFGTTFSLFQIGLITAVPFACAAVALYLNGRHSDRTGERIWHIAVPLLVGAVAIGSALYMPSPVTVILAISVAAAGSYSIIPIFWQLPSRFLSGAAIAAGMGLVAGLGNIAGFVAPFVTGALRDATDSYRAGMWVVAVVMVAGAVAALWLGRRPEFGRRPPAATAQPDAPPTGLLTTRTAAATHIAASPYTRASNSPCATGPAT